MGKETPTGKTRPEPVRNRKGIPHTAVLWGGLGLVLCLLHEPLPAQTPETEFPSIHISCPPLPPRLDFCGENVPLDYFLCRERLERELMTNTHLHGSTMLVLKRANRYFPIIEPILKEEGIPDDFKYLCVIESSLSNVLSPAQAAGFWQFLEGTARDYGLEVNAYVDERYNLKKATRAACRFLSDLKTRLGSWTLAAAAYNTGLRNIEYQIENQRTDSYYHLHTAEETSRYVYRILALKLILQNPQSYGFQYESEKGYMELPEKEITVDQSIENLFDFARRQGVSYQLFKLYNPWLRKASLPNKTHRKYTISLPASRPDSLQGLPPRLPLDENAAKLQQKPLRKTEAESGGEPIRQSATEAPLTGEEKQRKKD